MGKFANGLKEIGTYGLTENGGVKRTTTKSKLYDMFALGGAYRTRSDEDVILLFKEAFEEDEVYALKCLFYLRDVRGGQGERRFFRTCMKWLARTHTEAAKRNLKHTPIYGRWDDLYVFENTPLEKDMFDFLKSQLMLDVQSKTPSLLAKWLKSENTSSAESRRLAAKTRTAFGMSHRQYRKTLSVLRERINVLERLMSAGQWDKIEFDKIPSRAGMIYRNAFARHDIDRMKCEVDSLVSYEDFMKDEKTTVNAKDLYPYECVAKVVNKMNHWTGGINMTDTERAVVNKYWDNIPNVMKDATFNGLVVCDTSGSMVGRSESAPINVAVSLALYCAERANGPFKDTYVSFSSRPQLIETVGVDFVDKVRRIVATNLCDNTNLHAAFDLLLDVAIKNNCSQEDLPEYLLVISDMEIDSGTRLGCYWDNQTRFSPTTEIDGIRAKWASHGYEMPKLVWWNVQARNNTILDTDPSATYVSGFSPSIFKQLMTGKIGAELMYETLNSERYKVIH